MVEYNLTTVQNSYNHEKRKESWMSVGCWMVVVEVWWTVIRKLLGRIGFAAVDILLT
jgi:hypothetical protein